MSVKAYLYDEPVFLILMVSIAKKCISAVPISKCMFMYLARFGDSIWHILQFKINWHMSFFILL